MGGLVIALVILGGGLVGLVVMWLNEQLEDRRWAKVEVRSIGVITHFGKGVDEDGPE